MNGVQTRFKCKLDVKRCKRFVFPPSSLLPRSNALKTKAIRYFQTDRTLTRIVSPPLNGYDGEDAISTNAFALAPYARYSFYENKIVRLFLDMGFGFSTYKEKHADSVNGFEIGVKPGLAVKLNDNFSFITKVGFAGYRDDYYRGEENGFGVGLDGENISIGIEYEF